MTAYPKSPTKVTSLTALFKKRWNLVSLDDHLRMKSGLESQVVSWRAKAAENQATADRLTIALFSANARARELERAIDEGAQ